MASSARIFFAGVGTTFVILGAGFGGGLMMANSALNERGGYQARATPELPSPVRVILPTTAEAAQPPQPPAMTQPAPAPVQAAEPETRIDKPDARKAEAEVRERRKRHAERKARREAARAQQRLERRQHEQAPVMAFGGDDNSRLTLFGN